MGLLVLKGFNFCSISEIKSLQISLDLIYFAEKRLKKGMYNVYIREAA